MQKASPNAAAPPVQRGKGINKSNNPKGTGNDQDKVETKGKNPPTH